MRRRDGSTIWVRDRVVPVRDRRGRVRCYEGQLEDVTDEKRHREELETALRSKIELIGTVSHELRNPLTSIVGYAHLLSEALDPGSPEHAEMAAVVKQQAEDVADIVEDLLTAAQADAGTLRVVTAPLDLADEVRRVLAGLGGRHAGTLDVDAAPAPAVGDRHASPSDRPQPGGQRHRPRRGAHPGRHRPQCPAGPAGRGRRWPRPDAG